MRIKKFRNNEYLLEQGVWVRNPICDARPLDINSMSKGEASELLANEMANYRRQHMNMDDSVDISMEDVVIASDGYGWEEDQFLLSCIPSKSVRVIGVNGSLSRWGMVGEGARSKRTMTFYLVNNPYEECASFLPRKHRYYPNLVASTRTHPKFLAGYKGQPYLYSPTPDTYYSGRGLEGGGFCLDDYRNPICAAISLAVRKGARRIALFCCDDSFKDERPGAVRMNNGLFQYPQQIKCQKIIDAQAFWLARAGIKIVDCSSGIELKNATYIVKEELSGFFEKDKDEQV